jgi:hypothetical protein
MSTLPKSAKNVSPIPRDIYQDNSGSLPYEITLRKLQSHGLLDYFVMHECFEKAMNGCMYVRESMKASNR